LIAGLTGVLVLVAGRVLMFARRKVITWILPARNVNGAIRRAPAAPDPNSTSVWFALRHFSS